MLKDMFEICARYGNKYTTAVTDAIMGNERDTNSGSSLSALHNIVEAVPKVCVLDAALRDCALQGSHHVTLALATYLFTSCHECFLVHPLGSCNSRRHPVGSMLTNQSVAAKKGWERNAAKQS